MREVVAPRVIMVSNFSAKTVSKKSKHLDFIDYPNKYKIQTISPMNMYCVGEGEKGLDFIESAIVFAWALHRRILTIHHRVLSIF